MNWQAPISHHRPGRAFQPTVTLAHILQDVGFSNRAGIGCSRQLVVVLMQPQSLCDEDSRKVAKAQR